MRMNPEALKKVFTYPRKDKGLLVTVIGFDGSGKTTQIEKIAEYYKNKGRKVIIEREPTDWFREQPLNRRFLEEGGSVNTARVLALMAAADRLQHVNEVIIPALSEGAVVICDRYVYAAFGVFIHRGLSADFISCINAGIPKPDFAFYLDVPSKVLYKRLVQRDGVKLKYEERTIERIESITKTYQEMGNELIRIDGNCSINEVTKEIINIFEKEGC